MLKCKLSLNKKKLIKNVVTPHLWAHMIGVHTIIKNIFSSFNKSSRRLLSLCHTLQQLGRLWNSPGYTRGQKPWCKQVIDGNQLLMLEVRREQ